MWGKEKTCLNIMPSYGEKKKIKHILDEVQEIRKLKKKRRINKPTYRVGIRHSSLSQEHLDH